jgi:hypothetical protein
VTHRAPAKAARPKAARFRNHRRITAGVVTVIAPIAAVVAVVTALGSSGAPGSTSSGQPAAPGARYRPHGRALGQPLIPASGAYLGAYVQPQQYTSQGEIAAVQSFERMTGRPLELVHVYRQWQDRFPTAADRYFVKTAKILLITWGQAADTKKVISGQYDTMIAQRARAIRALGHPLLLEFRHEMDRPNLQSSVHRPRDFVAAWDHIRRIFTAAGTTNVGWVWCPTGYGFEDGRAVAFYPGPSEVDWVCADVYSITPGESLADAARPFLMWAAGTRKPVILGEFAARGNEPRLPAWLADAGRLPVQYPQVKAMVYFDSDGIDSNGRPFTYLLGGYRGAVAAFTALMAAPQFRPGIPGP